MGIITNPRKEKRKEKKIISPTDLIPFRFTSDSKKALQPFNEYKSKKEKKRKNYKTEEEEEEEEV